MSGGGKEKKLWSWGEQNTCNVCPGLSGFRLKSSSLLMGFESKHQLLQDYQNYHKVWYLYLLEHRMEKDVFQTSALSPGYVMCFTIGVSF